MRDKYGRTHYERVDGEYVDTYGRPIEPALGVPKTDLPPLRNFVELFHIGGGQRSMIADTEKRISPGYGVALVRYKSMSELMTEFPNHYFDCYGNFNTGVVSSDGYAHNCKGTYDHLAPTYFAQMGMTVHRTYLLNEGIKDTWYFDVVDR